jgi:hypothetical protein
VTSPDPFKDTRNETVTGLPSETERIRRGEARVIEEILPQ